MDEKDFERWLSKKAPDGLLEYLELFDEFLNKEEDEGKARDKALVLLEKDLALLEELKRTLYYPNYTSPELERLLARINVYEKLIKDFIENRGLTAS